MIFENVYIFISNGLDYISCLGLYFQPFAFWQQTCLASKEEEDALRWRDYFFNQKSLSSIRFKFQPTTFFDCGLEIFIKITMRLLNLKLKPFQKVTYTKMSNLCGLRMFCFEGSNDYVNLFVCLKLPISDKWQELRKL